MVSTITSVVEQKNLYKVNQLSAWLVGWLVGPCTKITTEVGLEFDIRGTP